MKKLKLFILITFAALFLASCTNSKTPTGNAVCDIKSGCDTNTLNSDDDYVRIPISEISSKLKKYSYNVGRTKVNYFVVKGSDGEPRTAFDACDVCGGYKGYRQIGTDIECNNCGRVFRIDGLGTKNKGYGCWPSFLDHKIEGDNILIKKSEIAEGVFRFR